MTLIPYGFILLVVCAVALLVILFPLEKILYVIWIGIFISAFFGAYIGIPGNDSIFLFRILLVVHCFLFLFMKQKELGHMRPTRWLFLLLGLWLVGFLVTLFWAISLSAGLRYVYYIFELSYLIFYRCIICGRSACFFSFRGLLSGFMCCSWRLV